MELVRNFAWAAMAGAFIPVMAVLNGRLGRSLGEPLYAAAILFVVGLSLFGVLSFFFGRVPLQLSALRAVSPVEFAGGLIVGFYVISATILAPRMGVANFIMMAVCAQMVFSVVIDHFGLFGAAVRPANAMRLAGVAVLVAGVVITQLAGEKPVEP